MPGRTVPVSFVTVHSAVGAKPRVERGPVEHVGAARASPSVRDEATPGDERAQTLRAFVPEIAGRLRSRQPGRVGAHGSASANTPRSARKTVATLRQCALNSSDGVG